MTNDLQLHGCGQDHVTHLKKIRLRHIFGMNEAKHVKFGMRIDNDEY